VERLERPIARVPDLVPISSLDEHQRALAQLDPLAVHDGHAGARDDVEPLVRAAVAVVWAASGLARSERHLSGLAVFVAQHDAEAVAELQVFVLHGILLVAEATWRRVQNRCPPADLPPGETAR